jgi:hypothetical protein
MAVNLGNITINGILAIKCDTDPSIGIGLVAPTGIVVSVIDTIYFNRTNKEGNEKFDTLQNSPIGVGITQMLGLDLDS